VGTGVLYALHERITLDLGYRFYSVGLGKTTINGPVSDLKLDPVTTGLACNEMLLTLQIYELFRRW
jgi:opacity protein-like surface antigen